MAQIWSEPFDGLKHQNQMLEVESKMPGVSRTPTLIQVHVYFVRVCSFTFEFHSLSQIEVVLEYYSKKIQPSGRVPVGTADHWECQHWIQRLPLFVREEPKRRQVVKALTDALRKFTADVTIGKVPRQIGEKMGRTLARAKRKDARKAVHSLFKMPSRKRRKSVRAKEDE